MTWETKMVTLAFLSGAVVLVLLIKASSDRHLHVEHIACATDCLSKGFKPVECKELCE